MYGGDKISPSYYRPYKSDSDLDDDESESESTTTYESEYSTTSSHEPDYSSPKALVKAAGIPLHTDQQQLKYDIGFKYDGVYTSYGTYDHQAASAATAEALLSNQPVINYGGTKLETKSGIANALIVVNSRDRDHQVFPNPTSVTIRLPRVYKNITSLQFNQIKLLSAFYYFRPDKANTTMYISEAGRNFVPKQGAPNGFPITIEPGSYDINGLLKQLNTKLNTYPIFYFFPNGINDFAENFEVTGDLGLNFNPVGDYYYDIANSVYVSPPQLTVSYIVNNFFISRYPNQSSYNTVELYIAYYYPPLKLYLLQNLSDYSAINLTLTTSASYLLPGQTPLTRVLYYFEGIDDPVVFEVIKNNLTFLDNFRTLNTFQNTPVNKYVVSLDTNQNIITFTSPNLNTSLTTIIANQYSNAFLNELTARGVSQPNYATSNAYLQQFNAVLLSMYNYLQSMLANVFAVNYDTYTLTYLAHSNYQVYINDGTNANNVNNTTLLNINNITQPLSNYSLQVDPPLGTWSNLASNLTTSYSLVNNTQFNLFYDITANTLTSTPIITPVTSNIFTNSTTNSADVIVPVTAENYTVFAFTSPVRQTLQVETLPRPLKYRYPAYNSNYVPANVASIFNYTYQYIDNSNFDAALPSDYSQINGNSWSNLLCNITGTQFAQSYAQGFSNGQKFTQTCGPFTVFNTLFYQFTTPLVSNAPANSVNKYPITFSIIDTGPNTNNITILMYHDRAAMMGDIPVLFNENSNNYKISFTSTLSPTSSNITISWNAYENNTYYILVRPATIPFSFSAFSVIPVITFPSGSNYTSFSKLIPLTFDPTIDPTTSPTFYSNFNYAQIYDPDWIRLPISSTLWGPNPSDNPNNSNITVSPPPIGYDVNGNSFDLTDYRPYSKYTTQTVLSTQYCFDPIGPNFDIFRFNSPYNTSNQTYFYPGSSNFIFSGSNQVAITTPGTIASRQYKLLNWFDLNYIGPTIINNLSNINSTFSKTPFTLTSTSNIPIGGYNYDVTGALSLYDGVCGFTFLPDDGIWNLTGVSFNSAVMNKSNNSNHAIAYIGIYNTTAIYNTEFLNISLNSALITLSLTSRRYYLPSQTNNPGFSNEYLAASNEYVFDNPNVAYGSYYNFSVIPSASSNTIIGYTESARVFLNKPMQFYSAIAFDASGKVTTISQLTGSLVPYPLAGYSVPLVSNAYFDGNSTENGKQLLVPSKPTSQESLPEGIDYSQVGYQQSMYFTTTAVHMLNYTQSIYDNAAMRQWSITSNIPLQGSIKGISAHILNTLIVSALNSSSIIIYNVYTYVGSNYNFQLNFQYSFSNISKDAPPLPYSPISIALLATNSTSVYYISYSGTTLSIYQNQSGYNLNYASQIATCTISSGETPQQMSVDNNGDILFSTYNSGTYKLYYMPVGGPISQYTVASSVINTSYPIYFDLELDPVNERSASVILSSNRLTTFRVTDFTGHNSSTTITNYIPSLSNIIYVLEGSNAAYYSLTSNNYWAKIQVGSPTTQVTSYQQFPQSTIAIASGATASKWIVTSSNIYANRYLIDGTLETAWQIFYPSYKFTFTKFANNLVTVTNTAFITPPEYFHTNLFVYNSFSALSNDIWGKWGAENPSNYLCSDTKFRGYQFNSYIENVPLESNQTYYIALRGYTPSEQFETMVRFNLPNRYDFGWLTLIDLANEILYLSQYQLAYSNNSLPPNFNPNYANVLSNFNQIFTGTHNYGGSIQALPCFGGVSSNPYASSNNPYYNRTSGDWGGFGDLYYTFINLYAQYLPINNLVNDVNSVAQTGVSNFIATQLPTILPSNVNTGTQYTNPLIYSLLFGSGNNYAFSNLTQEWGIGWNLGFPKVDTPFLTIHSGNSFYKILDDYIYVKLNPEYPINCLDTTGPENLQLTRESTGNVKGYNMKLLLNNFGGYAQTAILNPVVLNPPISRMDKLTLQLVDLNGNPLSNADCEWNGCLQITEALDQPTQDSSIIKLNVTQDVNAINN